MKAKQIAFLLSLTVLLTPLRTIAAEPNVQRYAELSAKERTARLKVLHRELALYSGKKRRDFLVEYNSIRWEFPEKRPKANEYIAEQEAKNSEQIKQLEIKIADLENPLKPYFSDGRPKHISDVGMLKRDLRVFQVIDTNNALVEFVSYDSGERLTPVRLYDSLGGSRVQHVTTGGPPRESSTVYWLSGVPTNQFSDGRNIELGGFYAVTGNRTYETDEGTNTAFLIEPFDIAPYEEMFTRRKEARIWTSKDARHKTEAVFVRYERGKLTLMNLEGKTTEVKLSDLSDADRQYVREKVKRASGGN
jgi:SLA1 homology domain 1, SHD1